MKQKFTILLITVLALCAVVIPASAQPSDADRLHRQRIARQRDLHRSADQQHLLGDQPGQPQRQRRVRRLDAGAGGDQRNLHFPVERRHAVRRRDRRADAVDQQRARAVDGRVDHGGRAARLRRDYHAGQHVADDLVAAVDRRSSAGRSLQRRDHQRGRHHLQLRPVGSRLHPDRDRRNLRHRRAGQRQRSPSPKRRSTPASP